MGALTYRAADDIITDIEKGEFVIVQGPSGAGKSTLVRTINLLQRPTQGEVFVNGRNLSILSPNELRNEIARFDISAISSLKEHIEIMMEEKSK